MLWRRRSSFPAAKAASRSSWSAPRGATAVCPGCCDTTADEMVNELEAGRPVLLLQNLGVPQIPIWHYAVLIGYDAERNVAILRSGQTERLEMKWQRFARAWHQGGRFAIDRAAPRGDSRACRSPRASSKQRRDSKQPASAGCGATAYETAISRWPDEPLAWLGLGNVALAEGNRAAAADAYLRAIMLAPDDAAARNNLAELLLDAGCLEESRRQVERASALAEGTPLEAAVADSRSKIAATARAVDRCQFEDRVWPD